MGAKGKAGKVRHGDGVRKYYHESMRRVQVAILAQTRAAVTYDMEPDEDNMGNHCAKHGSKREGRQSETW